MIETNRLNELIKKYKITPTQIYILWVLYTKDSIAIREYVEVFGNFKEEEVKDLVEKNLLIHTNRDAKAYNCRDLVVTLEFVEDVARVNPEEAWEEFFNAYPNWLVVNSTKIAAKTLTFPDEKSAKEAYKNIVSKSKFIHGKILAAIGVYKDINGGYATMKIDKFITGRVWEILEDTDNDRVKPSYY